MAKIKFKKSTVERIVREELSAVIREAYESQIGIGEAEDDPDKKDPKKKPNVATADKENDNVQGDPSGPDMAPSVGAKEPDSPVGEEKPADDDIPDEDVPTGDDPSDTEISQDVEDPEEEEPEGGDISKDIMGRPVQSISIEKASKLMPNAQELVIQFEDAPHPLRVLIGKSGVIKFFYKGTVHNSL